MQHVDTEQIQLVKYNGGGRLLLHQEWIPIQGNGSFSGDGIVRTYNRLLRSFIYLEDNCTGGETYFPGLKEVGPSADGNKFSRAQNGKGILFKPRKGNAVIWNNLFMDGSGDPRLSHTSLPVRSGTKIVNINVSINQYAQIRSKSRPFGHACRIRVKGPRGDGGSCSEKKMRNMKCHNR